MVLEITKGEKKYGEQIIFRDFSCKLDFMKHSIYRIEGDSGKGKTSLMRILSSLESLDRGEFSIVLGEAARGGNALRSSWMFQENRLLEKLSAMDNLVLIPSSYTASEKIQFFEQLLSGEDFEKRVSEYSGGMKRRLSFLRAMLPDFDLLFLDEPFTGIDEENQLKMERFLLEHLGKRAMVFASHEEPLLWKNYGRVRL
jgi:ABC superfamily ATP binding cassette transporter, ABC protein